MTQEEFQNVVLSELKDIKQGQVKVEQRMTSVEKRMTGVEAGQEKLEQKMTGVEAGQERLGQRMTSVEENQIEMKKDIKSVVEQIAILTEFREETNGKLDKLNDQFGTLEIVTAQNWHDIAKLKIIK